MAFENISSFIIFAKMNCQDQEFLDKLEVYQKFQQILKEIKKEEEDNYYDDN